LRILATLISSNALTKVAVAAELRGRLVLMGQPVRRVPLDLLERRVRRVLQEQSVQLVLRVLMGQRGTMGRLVLTERLEPMELPAPPELLARPEQPVQRASQV